MCNEDKKQYNLIQSYVKRKWFVSTAYRESFVVSEPFVPWYFETIVWEWDNETKKRGHVLYSGCSGSFEKLAMSNHAKICKNLILYGKPEIEESEE